MNLLLAIVSFCHLYFRLMDYLEAILDEKDADNKWIETMPEHIKVKHAVSLFELSVHKRF